MNWSKVRDGALICLFVPVFLVQVVPLILLIAVTNVVTDMINGHRFGSGARQVTGVGRWVAWHFLLPFCIAAFLAFFVLFVYIAPMAHLSLLVGGTLLAAAITVQGPLPVTFLGLFADRTVFSSSEEGEIYEIQSRHPAPDNFLFTVRSLRPGSHPEPLVLLYPSETWHPRLFLLRIEDRSVVLGAFLSHHGFPGSQLEPGPHAFRDYAPGVFRVTFSDSSPPELEMLEWLHSDDRKAEAELLSLVDPSTFRVV